MPTMDVELAGLQGGLVQHQVCVVRQLQHSRLEPVGLVVLTRAERQLVHVLQAHRQQVALKHHTHLIHSVYKLQNNFKSERRNYLILSNTLSFQNGHLLLSRSVKKLFCQ